MARPLRRGIMHPSHARRERGRFERTSIHWDGVDLRDYYDDHWTHVPEGGVDFTRLRYVLDFLEPGERVLDSGCRPGFLAGLLRDHGIQVTTMDVSKVGPERTRARGVDAIQVDLDTQRCVAPRSTSIGRPGTRTQSVRNRRARDGAALTIA